MRGPLARLTQLATLQYGVFTRAQALEAGVSRSAADWRVRRGDWQRVDFGVYRVAGTPDSWPQRLLAACLAGPAVASHRAAASLWNLPGFGESPVEVTAVRHRRRFQPGVKWHESVRLDETQHTTLDRIPVTDATRTVIDLGVVCNEDEVTRALDDALRRNLTSVALVQLRLEAFGPVRRGAGVVRRAVARRRQDDPVPESVLESEFDSLVLRFGLPIPIRQHRIRDHAGALVARVDFAYPYAKLAIEIDSVRFHAGSLDWRSDLARQNRIMELEWRVLRFTHAELLRNPFDVATSVRRALGSHVALRDRE